MSTTILAHRVHNGSPDSITLIGITPIDRDQMRDLPTLKDLKLVVTVPRNLKFHKKYFVLLKVIYDYMDDADRLRYNIWNPTELLNRLKIDLGLYTLFVMGPGGVVPEGTPVFIPDSISFDKMDDSKFARFYKDTIGVAIGKYTTNQTEASMMEAVNAVLRFE